MSGPFFVVIASFYYGCCIVGNADFLTTMKKVLLFSILSLGLSPLFIANGQARRISPPPSTGKINQRSTEPAPTPTPPAGTSAQFEDNSAAPDDGEVVKVETQLVTFPVRVMDRKNRFIGGLDKSNFKVF